LQFDHDAVRPQKAALAERVGALDRIAVLDQVHRLAEVLLRKLP
jgi:hypothetical protein